MGRAVIAFLIAATLTIAPAFVEGYYSNRWGEPVDFDAAAAHLSELPKEIGEWQQAAEGEMPSKVALTELGSPSVLSRVYRNVETGEIAQLMILVGQPGPLVRHPPNICYGAGNEELAAPMPMVVKSDARDNEFLVGKYRRLNTPGKEDFEVVYSLSDNGAWETPASARLRFGGSPVIYKVQVLSDIIDADLAQDEESAARRFTKAFVPAFFAHINQADAP